MTGYRQKTLELVSDAIKDIASQRTLDFGCGDGWFSTQLSRRNSLGDLISLETKERELSLIKPTLYDGKTIPFRDKEFDLVYAIDVVHHCADPLATLKEMMRCTKRHLLLKDHRHESRLGWLALCLLDELGNRRFDVSSPYHYQKNWEWSELIESSGFKRTTLTYPAMVHQGALGLMSNHLQFVALWERCG